MSSSFYRVLMTSLLTQSTSGRLLARARFNKGLSPEQLGRKTELSGRTIRNLEAGTFPSAPTAKRIADFFGVLPTDLWPPEDIFNVDSDGDAG